MKNSLVKNKKVKLKKTTIDDISSIYKWINHSSVRKNSFSTKKILKRENKFFWQKPHKDNKTGSQKAYRPNKIIKQSKDFKKYETWKPK